MENKNSGYVGNRMSKNALQAHQSGQFPISSINAKILSECGFNYSVDFFKWLCSNGYIVPKSFHHTGVAVTLTKFYSKETILYVAKRYNLSILYDMYLGRINKNDAKKLLGIKFVKARIMASLIGIKSTSDITIDAVKMDKYYFLSEYTCICPDDNQIDIISEWELEPSNAQWKNKNSDAIIRRLIIFKNVRHAIKVK